jgi:hypothetical protein
MSKVAKPGRDAARALAKLLDALAEAGARATPSDLEKQTLVVFAPRNGVTLAIARAPARVAEAAVGAGLAQWARDGASRALRLTDAGRAHLRRLRATDAALDPFRAQHGETARRVVEAGAPATLVNDAESPLAWLARRKDADGQPFLTPALIEAGERFRRDYEQAQLLQRVTARWDAAAAARNGGEGRVVVSDIAMDARERLSCVCEAVGPDLFGLLADVCGCLQGLETIESRRRWPARSGKVVLRIALERLARHYGLGDAATGPARAPTRHWGADDYRPLP